MIDHGQTLRGPAPDAIADSKVKLLLQAGTFYLFIFSLMITQSFLKKNH
jgi:hypothetical protein